MSEHQSYEDACHSAADWLSLAQDRLQSASDASGDRLALQAKLDRLQVCLSRIFAAFIA